MPVQFVIGRAGSGKTHRCLTSIAKAVTDDPLGPAIYWLVPKQATFMTQRALTSAVGAFCRVRISSFEELAREIFACAGGNVIPEVTPLGRRMVIGHLLRQLQPNLRYFASSARQPGLATQLDATFAEFERAGKAPTELTSVIDALAGERSGDVDHISLLAKLRDLQIVYEAYAKFLGQERLDQSQRLRQALTCIDKCLPLRGATLFVDGFARFSDFERRLLAGIAGVARHVEVMLLLDADAAPSDDSQFHQTEQTYLKLRTLLEELHVKVLEPLKLQDIHRFTNPALRELEASDKAKPQAPGEGIELIIAPDRRTEVDAVARRIRALWREGVRLREMAVLVRDLEPYHTTIDASFREHGITYFVDRRRSAAHHPLIQFMRAVFQIIRFDWPNESVITLLKSGLAKLSLQEADEVENYVAAHQIRGVAWERPEKWTYRRRLTREVDDPVEAVEEPETIDVLRRRVVELLQPTVSMFRRNETLTVKDITTELFALLERFEVRHTLSTWAKNTAERDPEQAAEHGQAWVEVCDLCEQMIVLLGDERIALEDFVDVLESGLEQFDLALTPPTIDQLLVGDVDRARCPELKAAFVLGLNEGEFPRAASDGTVLTEPERRELLKREVEIDGDRRRKMRDEELLGYIALTRSSQRLIVSRTLSNSEGRPTNPSRYWRALLEAFPAASITEIPRETGDNTRFIETPRQLLAGLMRWARADGGGPWPSLYQWFASYCGTDNAIATMRQFSWPAVGYTNDVKLPEASAIQLFGTPLEATPRQLETFATCPFKHFVRHGLALSTRRPTGVTGLDLSQVYHQVLDIVIADVLEHRMDWQSVSSGVIREFSQVVGQTLRGELMLSTARNKYLLDRVERTVGEIVAGQAEMMRRGSFVPTFTRVEFGEKGRLPALRIATPDKHTAILRGAIDRVDVLPDKKHVAVFDYRLSASALALQDVYYGLSLQLLTYLLVLKASGEELAGKPLTPVAAFCLQLLRRLGDVNHPDEALDPADPKFHLRIKPRGIINTEFLAGFDRDLTEGFSDVVAAYLKKDGSIGHRGTSDVTGPAEFAAMLELVHRRLGEITDAVLGGQIEAMPYRIGTETPCPRCEFRSVCRFEASINRYRTLAPMGREEVLARITEGERA